MRAILCLAAHTSKWPNTSKPAHGPAVPYVASPTAFLLAARLCSIADKRGGQWSPGFHLNRPYNGPPTAGG